MNPDLACSFGIQRIESHKALLYADSAACVVLAFVVRLDPFPTLESGVHDVPYRVRRVSGRQPRSGTGSRLARAIPGGCFFDLLFGQVDPEERLVRLGLLDDGGLGDDLFGVLTHRIKEAYEDFARDDELGALLLERFLEFVKRNLQRPPAGFAATGRSSEA